MAEIDIKRTKRNCLMNIAIVSLQAFKKILSQSECESFKLCISYELSNFIFDCNKFEFQVGHITLEESDHGIISMVILPHR